MVREMMNDDIEKIIDFLSKDCAINYFLLLGLLRPEETYERYYGEVDEQGDLKAVLLKRKSGNYQFYASGQYDAEGFASILKGSNYRKLMGVESVIGELIEKATFSRIEKLAYIAELIPWNTEIEDDLFGDAEKADVLVEEVPLRDVRNLSIENIDDVASLYTKIFKSFTPKNVMIEKLKSGRGRGVYIADHEGTLVSVAQSEFEDENHAVIVGVATDPAYRNRGLANRCLSVLCKQLLDEGKSLYLQYDNPEAGRIYEKMGFRFYDRVVHCYK